MGYLRGGRVSDCIIAQRGGGVKGAGRYGIQDTRYGTREGMRRWCDSEPRRTAFGIKLHEQIEKGKVTGSLKCSLAHQPVSKKQRHSDGASLFFGAVSDDKFRSTC